MTKQNPLSIRFELRFENFNFLYNCTRFNLPLSSHGKSTINNFNLKMFTLFS